MEMPLSFHPTPGPAIRPATLSGGPAPIALPDLARRIAALWVGEPQVSAHVREELLSELHDLDGTVDRLMMRCNAGQAVPAHHVRHCSVRYLRLREQWPDEERAA